MQSRYLLSLLSNHGILKKFHRTHGRHPSCKCRHRNCVSILFVISCENVRVPIACGTGSVSYQVATFCRGSAQNENSESLLVDWERKTISHCDSIPLLEILLNHSQNSPVLANPAIAKWAFVLFHDFLVFFCTENSSTRSSWALFISPISCILRIWVSRRTFSFRDNSSCSRACSLRDSI